MKEATLNTNIKMLVYASLLSALMAVGAYLAIPIGPFTPVPIVLQNMFVLLAGLLLGKHWGLISVALYLFIGALGFPVFAGGKGGIVHFLGPTGGFLIGYLPAVYVIGLISKIGLNRERKRDSYMFDLLGMIAGSLIIYIMGVLWFIMVFGGTFIAAISMCVVPFIIFDAIKIAAALPIARLVRPVMTYNR